MGNRTVTKHKELLYGDDPLKDLEKNLIDNRFPIRHDLGDPGETGENLYEALNCARETLGEMYQTYLKEPNGRWAWTVTQTKVGSLTGAVLGSKYFIHFMTEEDRLLFLLSYKKKN